jgi:hypothetical protein
MDKSEKAILIVLLSALGGCLVIALMCGAVFFLANRIMPEINTLLPTDLVRPTQSLTQEPQITITPWSKDEGELLAAASDIAKVLEDTVIPTADLNDLAAKFKGMVNVQTQLDTTPINYDVGDELDFYVINTDTNENRLTTATLQYETDEIYFWIEDGVYFDKRDLKTMMDRFSSQIYPTNQEFFGKEWIPGVDNDPYLYVLYATGMGDHVAGLSASTDVVLPSVHPYSNAHEMFYINADVQTIADPYTLSVMAHELQHLIHGYHDANEELWLNEGFSELSTLLNGYDAGGFDYLFSYAPDLQLNYWPGDANMSDPHYGASFLYVTYMLDRFGEEFTRAVVADEDNGFVSIDQVLAQHAVMDPITNEVFTADDLFADWVIANYLQNGSVLDGRYRYTNYSSAPKMDSTETIYDCSNASMQADVHQFGTDYIALDCSGNYEITFTGQPVVGVLPLPAGDHGKFWWSNRGDSSDILLSREFDFTNVNAPIILTYDVWYDIETDYDYLYLMASTQEGVWEMISTPSCTYYDPSGNNYGCGYNGQSDGWITESVDLSEYAGKIVELHFDYVTDGAVTGEGLALDNISIPQINYSTDLEQDNGGWISDGFAWIENLLPQTYLVSLINTSDSTNPILKFEVAAGETITIQFRGKPTQAETVLVISGSNRFTRQKAQYSITIVGK